MPTNFELARGSHIPGKIASKSWMFHTTKKSFDSSRSWHDESPKPLLYAIGMLLVSIWLWHRFLFGWSTIFKCFLSLNCLILNDEVSKKGHKENQKPIFWKIQRGVLVIYKISFFTFYFQNSHVSIVWKKNKIFISLGKN